MNLDADSAYERWGHLSPKMQPLTQASAQLIVGSIVSNQLLGTGLTV